MGAGIHKKTKKPAHQNHTPCLSTPIYFITDVHCFLLVGYILSILPFLHWKVQSEDLRYVYWRLCLVNRKCYRVLRSVLCDDGVAFIKTSRFEMSNGDWWNVQIWVYETLLYHQETMLQFLLAYLDLFWCACFLVSLWVCVCLRPNASSGTHTFPWYVFTRRSRVLRVVLCSVLGDHAKN